jgi:hypothetical protein
VPRRRRVDKRRELTLDVYNLLTLGPRFREWPEPGSSAWEDLRVLWEVHRDRLERDGMIEQAWAYGTFELSLPVDRGWAHCDDSDAAT